MIQNISDETSQKIISDPNAVENNIQINPEPLGEPSPTLPQNYPLNNLPNEKCVLPMLELVNCLVKNNFDNVVCESFQFSYLKCKKFRDSAIFSSIKNWECQVYLNSNNKDEYFNNLQIEKARISEMYNKSENESFSVRKRIDADVRQIQWRLDYLPHCKLNI